MPLSAAVPPDESERLALLHSFQVLDTAPEALFDDLARLAAAICGAPVALVSLVDRERQWFKARFGTGLVGTPRALSICAHAIGAPRQLLEVPDLAQDARFNDTQYQVGDTTYRFYAGMPLACGAGSALGTLCVLDTVPRALSAAQREALATLAAAVVSRLQLRRALLQAEGFFAGFAAHTPAALWIKDGTGRYVMANGTMRALYADGHDLVGRQAEDYLPADVAARIRAEDDGVAAGGAAVKTVWPAADGSGHWLVSKFRLVIDGTAYICGNAIDCSAEVAQQRALERHEQFYALLARLTALIARSGTLEALCLEAGRLAGQFFGGDAVDLRRLDGHVARLYLSLDGAGAVRDWSESAEPGPLWYDAALAGVALGSGQIALDNQVAPAPGYRAAAAFLSIPLFVERRLWGAITFYADRAQRFDSFHAERAGDIGNEISFGLERLLRAGELHRQAHTHPLSGLPSRLHFDERIAARAAAGQSGCVVLLHLDRLDEINSAYGTAALPSFLRQVAQRLASLVAARMQLSHVGTGRFALFIGAEERIDVPSFVASAILPLVQGTYQVDGARIWCSVNAGAAMLPADGDAADMLLVRAWEALAAARARGDGFGLYNRDAAQSMQQARQLIVEAELRDAIARREFVLHYQPKVDLRSGALNGAEALVRWAHPQRGLVPPGEFIGLLEETGLIIEVGRQVLAQAMADWRLWSDAGLAPPTIAVNVAPAQFRSPALLTDIEDALRLAGPVGQPLAIEITESSLGDERAALVATLNDIRSLRVPVAVDDFGTGYSSLAHLVTLPVDVLKVDRAFVSRMTDEPRFMALVTTIITLAHNLGLTVVAEGIETAAQADLLRALHCEQGQGYLYGRPVPAAQFETLLRQRQAALL